MANRLAKETSPYLLQHAHNPVDWFPWGAEALALAKKENRLILISIGYSACHWCHVMERESFEDPATAAIMNERFVNIKVDREERPDLDHIYMDAVQAISGGGGWPLNVFLTPDAKPFYGGTYFPPVRAYNRSSWREVLHSIHTAWVEKPEEILSQSENLVDYLQKANDFGAVGKYSNPFSKDDLATIAKNLLQSADTVWGGFGKAPKFPQTMAIQWLLRQYHYYNSKDGKADAAELPFSPAALLQQAELSLQKMLQGGIYDQIGGGFARYSTDEKWLAPHFEKMLYDNALLIIVLSEAYQLTGKQEYLAVIDQTMAFVQQDWQDENGGFFSAFDADSEGVEGKYYTWTREEIESIVHDKQIAELFCKYYDVSEEGNWEDTNILWVQKPLEAFCQQHGYPLEQSFKKLKDASQLLLQHRRKRIAPLLDDKKLLGWNALMIEACCVAGTATGNNEYLLMAEKATAYIEKYMKGKDGLYYHNEKEGKTGVSAFLDDLAYYVSALCRLQEATGNVDYITIATSITKTILAEFSENDSPFFYYTASSQKDVVVRKKETYDGAVPSGNSVMMLNLLYMGTLLNEPAWKEQAVQMVSGLQEAILKYPTSFGKWAVGLQQVIYGQHEIAVIGKMAKGLAKEILEWYLPNKVFQQSVVEREIFPLLAGKETGEKTMVFVCKEYACKLPVDNLKSLKSMF
ncbi:MAG TPA: thioredoxin domain-containing protein [Phnomibacter sp.]|nr:thioredoxin domain-containing protein [Phnomibacter sp.]